MENLYVLHAKQKFCTKTLWLIFILVGLLGTNGWGATWYFRGASGAAANTTSNWQDKRTGNGSSPTTFSTSGDIWNFNGNSSNISSWTVAGSIQNTNTNGSSTAITLTLDASSTFSIGGSLSTTNSISYTIGVGSTFNYSGAVQTIIVLTYGNLTTSGSGTKTLIGAVTVNGAVTIGTGTTLDVSTNNYGITLGGNWTNEGTFATGTGTVTFNGTSQQKIGGTVTTLAFNNVTISNTSGVLLLNNTKVAALNISSGSLTLTAGLSLSASGNTTLGSAQCLILQSDATGTASFIDNGTITGSGTAKIERYLTKYAVSTDGMFHFLSSPVGSDQAIMPEFQTMTNTTDDFYMWDEAQELWINTKLGNSAPYTWNTAFGAGNGAFEPGKGYLVGYDADKVKNFIGKPFTSDGGLTMSCTYHNGVHQGWNLLGNPFPSAIDWDLVKTHNVGMDEALYYYDNIEAKYNYYVGLTGEMGSNYLSSGSRYIPAMQGFMAHVNYLNTTGTVTMKNSDRVHENLNLYYKSSSVLTENVLNISVAGNGRSDDARICFYDQATENFDGDFDAYKLFSNNTSVPELYSVTPDNTELAINTLPLSQMYVTVPLGFKPGAEGDFTFTADGVSNFPSSTYIILEDLKDGISQKLNDNPVYAFTASPADTSSRFLLHFKDATSVPDLPSKETFTIHFGNGNINIITQPDVNAEIMVSNMLGQVVMQNKTNGNSLTTLNAGNLQNGVYVVSLVGNNKVVSKKIVIEK